MGGLFNAIESIKVFIEFLKEPQEETNEETNEIY